MTAASVKPKPDLRTRLLQHLTQTGEFTARQIGALGKSIAHQARRLRKPLENFAEQTARDSDYSGRFDRDCGRGADGFSDESKFTDKRARAEGNASIGPSGIVSGEPQRTFPDNVARVGRLSGTEKYLTVCKLFRFGTDGDDLQCRESELRERRNVLQERDVVFDRHLPFERPFKEPACTPRLR